MRRFSQLRSITRRRATLGTLLALIAGTATTLAWWGTRWTMGQSSAGGYRYQASTHWDGTRFPSGKLQRPIGIAVAPNGDVFVTDARSRVIHLTAEGEYLGEWGSRGEGPGQFRNPIDVATAPDGSVFVSDYDLDRVQKFTPQGEFLFQFGESGTGPGQFDAPAGLGVDESGSLYVADFYNHRIQKFDPQGRFIQTIGCAGRLGDGALNYPTDVTVTDGSLLVADAYNYQLQWFDPWGEPLGRAGYHLFWLWPRPASGSSGFNVPSSAVVGPGGLTHVADSGNHRVVMLTPHGEYLTEWVIPDANPNVYSPEHLALSPEGDTLYATDLAGNRILILKVKQP